MTMYNDFHRGVVTVPGPSTPVFPRVCVNCGVAEGKQKIMPKPTFHGGISIFDKGCLPYDPETNTMYLHSFVSPEITIGRELEDGKWEALLTVSR